MLRQSILTAITLLALESGVDAGTLLSAPVPAQNGQSIFCNVVNVSTKTTSIFVDIVDDGGNVVSPTTCLNVGPNQGCIGSFTPAITGPVHCRITAAIGKGSMRGALYNNVTGNSTDAK